MHSPSSQILSCLLHALSAKVSGGEETIQGGAEALRRQGRHRELLRGPCRPRQQSPGSSAEAREATGTAVAAEKPLLILFMQLLDFGSAFFVEELA